MSSLIFSYSSKTQMRAAIPISLIYYQRNSLATNYYVEMKHDTYLLSWIQIDLVYHAILNTNDYIGNDITDNQYLFVYNDTYINYERDEGNGLDRIKNSNRDFMLYLYAFLGEQFKFQMISETDHNTSRELYILLDLAKEIRKDKNIESIENIVKEEVGVDYETVFAILGAVSYLSLTISCVNEIIAIIINTGKFERKDIETVVNYYTVDYKTVRESGLKKQLFYTKPFVKSDDGNIFSISVYLNIIVLEHALLWICRNYYINKTQNFINDFGYYFELFFEEMINYYLDKKNILRIGCDDKKTADWIITLGKYKLIIEQKSSLLGIQAKQQVPDISVLETYLKRNIIKALEQLKNSEEKYGLLEVPKIILLYDDYINPNILKFVFDMDDCNVVDDGYYWIMRIREFEDLISLYKEDEDIFNKVMKERIKIGNDLSKGTEFNVIFDDYNIPRHSYLKTEKINKYEGLFEKYAKKIFE